MAEKEKKEKAKANKAAKVRKIMDSIEYKGLEAIIFDAIIDQTLASLKEARRPVVKILKVLDNAIAVLDPAPKA
jgi:hypothetical protein